MTWSELYDERHEPVDSQIREYVGTPCWEDLARHIQDKYRVQPKLSYSRCSMDNGLWKGWNVQYKKGGKSLCTLYPKQGTFTSLIAIGFREMNEAEQLMPLCSEYTQTVFMQTTCGHWGKSLAINITNENILSDVKELIALRAGVRQQGSSFDK